DRMDSGLPSVGNKFNRHEFDAPARVHESQQHFGIDLEVPGSQTELSPGLQVHEPKTALCVWKMPAGLARQALAHPAIDKPPDQRHWAGIIHPITDHEPRPGFGRVK